MCMMLYMASDHQLPEIEWDDKNPAFFVTPDLHPAVEVVRKQFSKYYVYYAGSHEHCGCGFGYCNDDYYRDVYRGNPDIIDRAIRENAAARETVRRLREYLEKAAQSGPVELYSVWAGAEGKEPEERIDVGPAYFSGDTFGFGEGQFITVHREMTTLGL